jgi:uncharacterized phage protein (TIGR02218 family)/uncharacterized protein (TIGR02217 family)
MVVDINQVFPINESSGIQVTLSFANSILSNSAGVEQRIVYWEDPIRTFNFARKILTASDIATIQNFFTSVSGANYSFLYTDKSDYSDQGAGCLYPLPDGTRTTFQLCKIYQYPSGSYGSYTSQPVYFSGINTHLRPITQPNVVTSVNGSTTGWTLGNNGQITFATAPAAPANSTPQRYYLIPAVFSFYVPVTFENDEFEYSLASPTTFQINKLILKEFKQNPYITLVDILSDSSTTNTTVFPVQLDFLAGNQDFTNYDTEIITLSSGFRNRKAKKSVPFYKHVQGERKTFTQSLLNTLLNFWLSNKGNGALFYYQDTGTTNNQLLARFNTQELTYTLQSNNKIYTIAPLELRVYRSGGLVLDNPMVSPADLLSTGLLKLARICNITVPMPDGTTNVFGFSTHDRDTTIEGITYLANTAFEPTALQRNINIQVDNQEIKTIISSTAITESMLASGMFDNATITVAAIDYSNPPSVLANALIEQIGVVGQITSSDTQFTMENLTVASSLLRQSCNQHTSYQCRWDFCDVNHKFNPGSHCTLNIANYRWNTSVIDNQTSNGLALTQIVIGSTAMLSHGLAYGNLYFTSGPNKGISYPIWDNYPYAGGTLIIFSINLMYQTSVGDTLVVQGGCDKTQSTCQTLYNNYINFGGEPQGGNFMPSNDFYFVSPVAGN